MNPLWLMGLLMFVPASPFVCAAAVTLLAPAWSLIVLNVYNGFDSGGVVASAMEAARGVVGAELHG